MAHPLESLDMLRRLPQSDRTAHVRSLIDSNQLDHDGSTLYLWHMVPSIAEEQKQHHLNSDDEHVVGLAGYMWQRLSTRQKGFWAHQTSRLQVGGPAPLNEQAFTTFLAGVEKHTRSQNGGDICGSDSDSPETRDASSARALPSDLLILHNEIRERIHAVCVEESILGQQAFTSKSSRCALRHIASMLRAHGMALFAYHQIELMHSRGISRSKARKLHSKLTADWNALPWKEKLRWEKMSKDLGRELMARKVTAFAMLDRFKREKQEVKPKTIPHIDFRLQDPANEQAREQSEKTSRCIQELESRRKARKERLAKRMHRATAMPKADVHSRLGLVSSVSAITLGS